MKKLILLVVALLTFTACQKEATVENLQKTVFIEDGSPEYFEFVNSFNQFTEKVYDPENPKPPVMNNVRNLGQQRVGTCMYYIVWAYDTDSSSDYIVVETRYSNASQYCPGGSTSNWLMLGQGQAVADNALCTYANGCWTPAQL